MAGEAEVMEALGRALFAAQNFEINVGTLLLMMAVAAEDQEQFQDGDGNRSPQAVKAFIDEVDRLTLGQLKGKLESFGVVDSSTISEITEINQMRRRLVHYFVSDYNDLLQNDEGRDSVLCRLHKMEEIFRGAWVNLQNFLIAHSMKHL